MSIDTFGVRRIRNFDRRSFLKVAGPAALFFGCQRPHKPIKGVPAFSYQSIPGVFSTVRRVVILPTGNETKHRGAEEIFQKALAEALQATGHFEVIRLAPADLEGLPPPVPSMASYSEKLLALLSRRYRAEGVAFSTLRSYHPYWPMRIGASVNVVDTREAVTMASVDGIWDASQESIARQARGFFARQTFQQSLPHNDLILHSPRNYSAFVAYQIATAIVADAKRTHQTFDAR